MNSVVESCKNGFYSQFDSENLSNQISKNTNLSVKEVSAEMLYIVNKVMTTDPCSHFYVEVCRQVYKLLEKLYEEHSDNLEIDETIFEYFLMGYNSYSQLSEIISDLRNFNISQEVKTRLYRLPTYTSIVESCLANFLRVIALLTGKAINKDYTSQNTLGKLVTVMNSNGYNEITKNINVNLRNAINHGKVEVKRDGVGEKISFYYVENRISKCIELNMYEFDRIIDSAFDTASGVLLGLSLFINNNLNLLNIDTSKKEYTDFSLLSMKLSIPGVYCKNISDIGDNKQLNIEVEIQNTDRGYIAQIATMMAILVFNHYKQYDKYMISFTNPRMLTGWIRYTKKEIFDMYIQNKGFDVVLKSVIERKDAIIFDPSHEEIDLNETKYFCFPNYTTDRYKVNNIEDASIEDKKRLRAHLFIGDIKDKQEIIEVIKDAIEWLKYIKNPPSPKVQQKHGSMEADALYINVYKKDYRTNKELFPNNENFVCFVDYNLSGETTLKDGGLPGGIWNKLYHEKMNNIAIAWREGIYFTRQSKKVGRNDLCPCGSKKKYKKCCGK
ncbi:SecC motif-containing protein [[Clostridium] sordellii]|uniref:SEC-C metal-binding domain-containing protein n=1 Tax=Paraclostridium sordellii TaxID=1505 RepID=UPI0005E5BFA2|nr:SEC-C metal-binding domain-containing protein [Paeniclostridium sordellii]CEQ29784.1 SecC motif-containing protein [[Clostridium] sordellii] [Paeniclostridium sordellii]